jgi:ketosteroid isomerase-like protein
MADSVAADLAHRPEENIAMKVRLTRGVSMSSRWLAIGFWIIVLTVAQCRVQQARGSGLPAPGPARADSKSGDDVFRDQVIAQERAELDSLKTGDLEAFANFLADDAVFVDAEGSAGKAEVVKNTSRFRLREYSMDDVKVVSVSPDAGIIIYKIVESGTSHGKDFSAKVHVSAVWVRRGGKWVCVFSQETNSR